MKVHNRHIFFLSFSDMEQRYYGAAETRNNLVAASQNLQGAHSFLPNITFPYCGEDEVETLNKVSWSSI